MRYIFLALILTISVAAGLKCHYCSGFDYLPANIQSQLSNLNISLDDSDTTLLAGNCKSKDDSCSNGTWCAKKTVEYRINFWNIKYTYHTYYKTCVNSRNDTATEPENGKCYNDNRSDITYTEGISRSVNWCYCNNKDYCNDVAKTYINVALLLLSFLFSNQTIYS